MTFYTCIEDGVNTALYERRVRHVSWWGNFCHKISFPIEWDMVEYKRVTMAPGQTYTHAVSDWFTRTFSESTGKYIDSYKPLSFSEGWKKWFEHKFTRG